MHENLLEAFSHIGGQVGFYYHNLVTGESYGLNENMMLIAASVIKLPIMVAAFSQAQAGALSLEEPVLVTEKDKLPSCGVLSYLHDGVTLPLIDLITLMIIVSDNTATNLIIRKVGLETINQTIDAMNLTGTRLNRPLFRPDLSRQGIENYVTARDMGLLLEKLYRGEIVSPQASQSMLDILAHQQLNGKIPFHLRSQGILAAHKTGEDAGITHDVGIVYAPQPFVVCYLGNQVDVTVYERLMQDMTKTLVTQG